MRKTALALVLMVACGGEDVPSCQQALESFYGVGCVFSENGRQIPVGEMIQRCKDARSVAPASCMDELDNYQACLGSIASDTECADCTREQDAILTCD
jgi:hypothetical protein